MQLVYIDFGKVNIDLINLVRAGFTLLHISNFRCNSFDIVKPLNDFTERSFLTQDHTVNKMSKEERAVLAIRLKSLLDKLEAEGYIKNTYRV